MKTEKIIVLANAKIEKKDKRPSLKQIFYNINKKKVKVKKP